MAEISPNIVLDGITLALKEGFPDSEIYTEDAPQELNGGDFMVSPVNVSCRQESPVLGHCSLIFSIVYFPKQGNEECLGVSAKIYETVYLITLAGGNKLRLLSGSGSVTDGALQYTTEYFYRYRLDKPEDNMEGLKIN